MKQASILFLSLVVGVLIYLVTQNQSYPRSDSGDFALTSQRIYLGSLNEPNLLNKLWIHYSERTWKPVAHPAIGAALLNVTDGRLVFALNIYKSLVLLLIVIFAFRFCRNWLDPWLAALLVSGWLVLPSIFWILDLYTAEPILILLSVMVAHQFVQFYRHPDSKRALSLGVVMGLATWARPGEIALMCLGASVFLLISKMRDRKVHRADLVLLSLQALVSIWVIFFFWENRRFSPPEISWRVGLWFLVALGAFFGSIGQYSKRPFSLIFSVATMVFLFWYGPFLPSLMNWIYEGSFSQVAQLTGGKRFFDLPQFFARWVSVSSGAILSLFFIPILAAFILQRKRMNVGELLLIMGFAITPVFLATMANNADPRYHVGFLSILILGFGSQFLAILNRVYAHIVVGGFVVLSSFQSLIPDQIQQWGYTRWFSVGYMYGAREQIWHKDPAAVFAEWINQSVDSKSRLVNIASVDLECRGDLNWTIDPWVLEMIAREKNYKFKVFRPYSFGYPTIAAVVEDLSQTADYVLSGPIGPCYPQENGSNPTSLVSDLFVQAHKQKRSLSSFVEVQSAIAFGRDGTIGKILLHKNSRQINAE